MIYAIGLIFPALIFCRVLFAQYLNWDDIILIQTNANLQMDFWPAMQNIWGGFILGDYLPLFQSSYWLENAIFGLNPAVSHGFNLALHLLNTALLIAFLKNKKISLELILLAALLFALHPLQVESIAWASERKGLLATSFLLLTLIQYDRKNLSLSLLFFALSLLSKTIAILFPMVIVLDIFLWKKWNPKLITYCLGMFAIAAVVSYIRIVALDSYLPGARNAHLLNWEHLSAWIVTVPTAIGHYIISIFAPFHLSLMYPLQSQYNMMGLELGVFVVAFIGLIAHYFFVNREKKKDFLYYVLFIGLLLFPVLNFFPRGNFVNDRYLYLPLIPASLICLQNLNKFVRVVASIFIVMFAILSFQRTAVWQNSETLWLDTVEKNPLSQTAMNNLAHTYRQKGDLVSAISYMEKALSIKSDDVTPQANLYVNLAELYLDSDKEKAKTYLLRAQDFPMSEALAEKIKQDLEKTKTAP